MAEEPKTNANVNANVNEDRDVTEHMIDVDEYLELEPPHTTILSEKRGKWHHAEAEVK